MRAVLYLTLPFVALAVACKDPLTTNDARNVIETVAGPVVLASTRLDFGAVQPDSSYTRTVAIYNRSSARHATIAAATIAGRDTAAFHVASPLPPFDIAPNDSVIMSVLFGPILSGNDTAVLVVNAVFDSTSYVLRDTLSAAVLPVLTGVISADSLTLDFRSVSASPTGANYFERTVAIHNIGSAPITFIDDSSGTRGGSSVTVQDSNFAVVPLHGDVTVAPQESISIGVTFAPVRVGHANALMSVHPQGSHNTLSIALTGFGATGGDVASASADSLMFGSTPIDTAAFQSFDVFNPFAFPITIVFVGEISPPMGMFKSVVDYARNPQMIQPGGSATVQIDFTPTAQGNFGSQVIVSLAETSPIWLYVFGIGQ